jgi:bla regulator protein blaR1
MISVAEILSLPQSRVLLGGVTNDQTGLKGRYTMELDYSFPSVQPIPRRRQTPPASLSTAIREQWGLRFVPGRGPFQVLVVESAQLPTKD